MARGERSDQDRYDEVRGRLRERGYLQHGIERFFLKEMVSAASPLTAVMRTALKAAVLGAPLLGGILALATVAVNRPLLGAADGLVIWVWLAVLAAPVLFILDLSAAGILALLAGRRGALSGDGFLGGLLVGLPLLGYLVLVWWLRTPGFGLAADFLFAVSALAVAAAVGWFARFVSIAGVIGSTGEVPVRGRAGFAALTLVLLPLAAGLFLLPRAGGMQGDRPATEFTVDTVPYPLVFIGIDGLDGSLVQALAERGAVDRLLATMEDGSVFPTHREPGKQPPEIWTSLLTGMPPEVHRVAAVDEDMLPGVATPIRKGSAPLPLAAALGFLIPARTMPATGVHRTVRTLWEIAGLKQASAAVGWWASWPAQDNPAGGYVVTDRAFPKLLAEASGDRDTAPAALFSRLAEDHADQLEEQEAMFLRWFGDLPPGDEVPRLLRESYLIDRFALTTIRTLLEDPEVRSGYVYLPGLDILRTRLLGRTEAGGIAMIVQTEQALQRYVSWLDQQIGSGLRPAGQEILVLVADPGRSATGGEEGFVLLRGPGIASGCVGPVLDPLQVAPLVLDLLGYPPSDELTGASPSVCLPGADRENRPAVRSYGRREQPTSGVTSDFDPELMERLRALGYIR